MAVKKLSVFAERMMPDFVHRDHIQFTKFIRYYFEYLEQEDGVYDYASGSLDYMDIDRTKDGLLEEFRNTYLLNFPEETEVDVRFLVKHIREFYKSKGSEESYKFLFRLLFGDDDIDIYYPKLNILRSSDGKWMEDPSYDLGGYWKNTDGFLSSDMKLQDNYYYQDFSYEIISDVTRFYYENVVKQNLHPSGQLMFGRNVIETDVPMSMDTLDYDKYDDLKNTDLGLVQLWGGTPYVVSQTQKNSESILIDVNGYRQVESIRHPFVAISGTYATDDVIGIRKLGHAIADNETFNAAGTTYTLDGAYTSDELMVWVGNLKVYEGIDFTISGNDIVFGVAPTEKVYVLKHTQTSREVISGVGTEKHITLTDHPQGYLLNKIIIFGNGIILEPDWYDPITKRVYFLNYVPDGTDNIEVLHMEQLGYADHVTIHDSLTKYNISINKNVFNNFPKSPYVSLITPDDTISLSMTDGMSNLLIFVNPHDDINVDSTERSYILSGRTRPDDITLGITEPEPSAITAMFSATGFLDMNITDGFTDIQVGISRTEDANVSITDGNVSIDSTFASGVIADDADTSITDSSSVTQTTEATDISFTATSTISTVAEDFTLFDDGDTIVVVTTSGTNNGTYTISGAPSATTITISETSLTTEDAATAGTVSISRTI